MDNTNFNFMNFFSDSDLDVLRLHIAINHIGKDVLLNIFPWVFRRSYSEIKVVLDERFTKKKQKDFLMKYQLDLLKNCKSEEDFKRFDFSLIYNCFNLVSDLDPKDNNWKSNDGNSFESILGSIKEIRNKFSHLKLSDKEIRTAPNLIHSRLIKAAELLANRFDKQSDLIIFKEKIKTDFNNLTDMSYITDDEKANQEEVFLKYFSEMLKDVGSTELRNYSKRITPMKILGWQFQDKSVDVSMLYTPIALRNMDINIPVEDKELLHATSAVPITIITGNGGVGKTTLLKAILNDWCIGEEYFKGSMEFDFIFHIDCRNYNRKNFNELLFHLLPNSMKKIKPSDFEYLKTILLSHSILFLIDGFDESDENTLQLITDILQHAGEKTKCIFTSRPHKIDDLRAIFSKVNKNATHIKVSGFDESFWMSLVKKVTDLLQGESKAKETRERVLTFLNSRGYKFWGLSTPFMITWIAFIAAENPKNIIAVETISHLMKEMEDTMFKKWKTVLIGENPIKYKSAVLTQKIPEFQHLLGEMAYNCIMANENKLSEEDLSKIISMNKQAGLPHGKFMSIFFNERISILDSEIIKNFSFHHKTIQEYYAAKYIVNVINTNPDVIKSLKQSNLQTFSDMMEMIIFTVDFLSEEGRLEEHFVNILELAEQFGANKDYHWTELLAKQKNIPVLAKYVAIKLKEYNLLNWIIKDSKVVALESLLKYVMPDEITITLQELDTEPSKNTHLIESIKKLSKNPGKLSLVFLYYYVMCLPRHADDIIDILSQPDCCATLDIFQGSLSQMKINLLPSSLRVLTIRVDTEQLEMLNKHLVHLKYLEVLEVHYDTRNGDDPASIPCLDIDLDLNLALPRIKDETALWGGQIIGNITKRKTFNKVKLFASKLTYDGAVVMVNEMVKQGVKFSTQGHFEVRTNYNLSKKEKTSLESLCLVNKYNLYWRYQ